MLVIASMLAQPVNNACQNAIEFNIDPLQETCLEAVDFIDATFDGNSGACAGSLGLTPPNVWFSFTAVGPEITINVNSTDGMAITLVRFPGGIPCAGINFIDCATPGGVLMFDNLIIGEEYYFFVSGPSDQTDPTIIQRICVENLQPEPPPNNEPCDAVFLNPGAQACGTTENALQSFNANSFPCPTAAVSDVWYTFNVNNTTDKIELEITNGSIGGQATAILGQFNGGCTGTFTWFPDEAYCGPPSTIIEYSCLDPGQYYVMISTSQADQGEFCVDLTLTPAPPDCAQNNDCNNPIDLGTPVLNEPISCFSGCNIGACGENFSVAGCNYTGSVVWYSITTPANAARLNVVINGTGDTPLMNPQVQVFTAQCGGPSIGGCQTGANGSVNLIGLEIAASTTYYIAVANGSGDPGYFDICFSVSDPQTACLISASVSAPSGPFCPEQEVNFSYSFTYTSAGNNCQWPHAVIPVFGNCWDISDEDMPDFGQWVWFGAGQVFYADDLTNTDIFIYEEDGISKLCYPLFDPNCAGSPLGPNEPMPAGWYYTQQQGNCGPNNLDDPNNTWGQPCGGCGGQCSATFNFNIMTKALDDCLGNDANLNCGIQFFVFSDRQTGCWTQGGANTCGADVPLYYNATLNCVSPPVVLPDIKQICSGDNTNIQISSDPFGPGITYSWEVGETNGVQGASGGSGSTINQQLTNPTSAPQIVTYLVTATDPSGCPAGEPTEILVEVFPQIMLDLISDPEDGRGCAQTEFFLDAEASGGSGGGFSYQWTPANLGTSPSISVLPGSQGTYVYSVQVTDAFGCTEEAAIDIVIADQIEVEFQIDTTEFCAQNGPNILFAVSSATIDSYTWTPPPSYNLNINGESAVISAPGHSGVWSIEVVDIFGCTASADTLITVFPDPIIQPVAQLPDPLQFCIDDSIGDEPFNFYDYFFVINGDPQYHEWGGTAGTFFGLVYLRDLFEDPNNGPGVYTVTLDVSNENNCVNSMEWEIEILGPPELTLTPIDALCATADPVDLLGSPAGGDWSGSGVVDNTFNPNLVGAGEYTVYYDLIDGSCSVRDSMIIQVNAPPVVAIDNPGEFCFNSPAVQLIGSPAGGEWSGIGVDDDGLFDPAISLPGTHTITYTYEQDGCFFPVTRDLVVYQELEINYDFEDIVCLTDKSIFTFTGIAPNNADPIWDYPDASTIEPFNNFDAEFEWATPGIKEIGIQINLNLPNDLVCTVGPVVYEVEVIEPFEDIVIVCEEVGTTFVTFSWNEIAGASGYLITYNGVNSTQDPDDTSITILDISPGEERDVTITVQALGDGVCGDGDPVSFTCTSLPCPDITLTGPAPLSFCLVPEEESLQLDVEVVGSDGSGTVTWSGDPNLDQNGLFDVQAAGPGSYTLTYTIIEQECTYSTDILIDMLPPPVPEWSADEELICKDETITFTYTGNSPNPGTELSWEFEGGNPATFDGDGPIDVTWDESGVFNVSVTITDINCQTTYEGTIEVEEPLEDLNIQCGANPVSVTFFWDEVPGALHYLLSIDGAAPIVYTETSIVFDGLDPETVQSFTITLQAVGDGVCGNGEPVTFTCETKECEDITVSIDEVDPICLNADALPINLTYSVVGSMVENTVRWEGPGITDTENGIFDPQVAGVGNHEIIIRLIEDFCPYTDTITIEIIEVPSASFDILDLACIDEELTATYTGGDPAGLTFDWMVDGGSIVSGAGSSEITVSWATGGNKTVELQVTDANGCVSDIFTRDVEIREPLLPPVFNDCQASIDSLYFSWAPVVGATGYRITVNGMTFDITDNFYGIGGLAEGQQVSIIVIALGDEPCGDSEASIELVCETEVCPEITLSIQPVDDICLLENSPNVNLEVIISGGTGDGTQIWTGTGIIDEESGIFDPNIAGVGSHVITLDYSEGLCFYDTTITIVINFVPILDFTVVSPVCVDQISDIIFTGNANPGSNFVWDVDGGQIVSGDNTGALEVLWTTDGIKTISLDMEENGCVAETAIENVVVEDNLLMPALSCNSTLTSITYNWNDIPGNDGYLISINGDDPIEIGNVNTYDFPNMVTGDSIIFTIIALNDGPCGDSEGDTLKCFAADCPEVDVTIVEIDPICLEINSQDVQLNANINGTINGEETFTWTGPGISDRENGMFDPVIAGPGRHQIFLTYRVTVCPYQASGFVDVIEAPQLDFELTDPKCFGINDGLISVLDIEGGEEPYSFSVDQSPFTENLFFTGLRPGNHEIVVRDRNGCMNSYDFDLSEPNQLMVDLGPSILIDQDEIINLGPELNVPKDSIISYLWEGDQSITCPTCDSTMVSPLEQVTIQLTVMDVNNCIATNEVTIFVRLKKRVFIPNGFTPNGDGTNDNFTIFAGPEVSSIKSLQIFDRWGNMVFERLDFLPLYQGQTQDEEGWDGSFRGRMVRPGVFVYHAIVEFADGSTDDYYGEVTLMNTEK